MEGARDRTELTALQLRNTCDPARPKFASTSFPEGSINHRVGQRLASFARQARAFRVPPASRPAATP